MSREVSKEPDNTYKIICSLDTLKYEIVKSFQAFGWIESKCGETIIFVDSPWGAALKESVNVDFKSYIIVTDNPCPEYWEDLWSFKPRALLAGGHTIMDLTSALSRSQCESFRQTPLHDSSLSDFERSLLRYAAMGWSNRAISELLNLNNGTIKNGLWRVFQKLGIDNRCQAALYYWGLWHLLDGVSGS